MGEDCSGLALARFFHEACEVLLACGMVPQEQHRGFGEGPREVGMADLLARGPIAFAGGFFGTLDQPARGDKLLHAWKAMNIVDLIQPHECADLADPWD